MRTILALGLAAGLGLTLTGCAGGSSSGADAADAQRAAQRPANNMAPAVQPAAPLRPADVLLGVDRNGSHVPLKVGQSVQITLPGSPVKGYVWELQQVDTNVLRRDGEVVYTPSPAPSPGVKVDGTFTARFTAVRPGDTWLKLVYHKPFGTKAPKNTYTAHVMVAEVS